jgi:hypothetical protein
MWGQFCTLTPLPLCKNKLGKLVKEWFDTKCKFERQNYRKLKRKINHQERKYENLKTSI